MIHHPDLADVVFIGSVILAALGCLGLFVWLLTSSEHVRAIRTPLVRHTPEPRTVRTLRLYDQDRED